MFFLIFQLVFVFIGTLLSFCVNFGTFDFGDDVVCVRVSILVLLIFYFQKEDYSSVPTGKNDKDELYHDLQNRSS